MFELLSNRKICRHSLHTSVAAAWLWYWKSTQWR